MIRIRLALLLGAALLVSASAGRALAAPSPVPDLKPDLSSMMFLIGTWNCHATVRGADRPDTATFRLALQGRWIAGHDVAPPFDPARKRAIIGDYWTTYNVIMKQWVGINVDDFGNYGMQTPPGWNGNSLTWTTTVSNDGSTGTDVFTKVSDTETRDVATGKDKNGKAQPTTTTVCKKQVGA